MAEQVKLYYRNILETSTVAVTTENASFPKYRLYDRDIGKLFKGNSTPANFYIALDQGATIQYEVDRLIIPAGHNLTGLVSTIEYSDNNFTDIYLTNQWTQSGAGLIDIPLLIGNGVELVTNGDMELDSSWPNYASPEVNERSTVQKHGGTYSRHINDSTPDLAGIYQVTPSLTAGQKYKFSFWYYIVLGTIYGRIYDGAGLLGGTLFDTLGAWKHVEYVIVPTVTGPCTMYFQNASGAVAAEFYIDDVSIQMLVSGGITSRCWRLNIASPAAAPELSEMFLGKLYQFQANPLIGAKEGSKKNIFRDETQSGLSRRVKFGNPKRMRSYDFKDIISAQKTDFESWDSHCEGTKSFYLYDHYGNLIFMELSNDLEFNYAGEYGSEIYYDCHLELLEVL